MTAAASLATLHLLVWSAAIGAMGLVVVLAAADAAYSRSRAAMQTLAYLFGFWLVVALLSGFAVAVWPSLTPFSATAQVLAGPFCAALGSYGCSEWLFAHKRDRVMKISLQATTLSGLLGAPLCLLLEPAWQLPASAALSVFNMAVALWISVRAAQLGDRLAWGLALGCLLSLPVQMGLYALALGSHLSLGLEAGVALLAVLSVLVTATVLWLRHGQNHRLRAGQLARREPVTQLYSSLVMVQKIISAQKRRLRTRRDGALMAVLVFEPEKLLQQVGQVGLNDIYIQLAQRMQRHTGVVNPAGRYYDRCFVVLLESLHSPRWMRTLGLRVASSLRRPMEVTSLEGETMRIVVDVAVGMVHLSATARNVDQLLHEAQGVATAARSMRSRAAMLDPQTRQVVAIEDAGLDGSWRQIREERKEREAGESGTSRKPARQAARTSRAAALKPIRRRSNAV